jgi:dihydrofolate reductase
VSIEEVIVPQLVSELIVTLDMFARGLKSPGYYGYLGPEFGAWLKTNNEKPHRTLMGRKTYDLMNSLPEEARDEGWHRTTEQPGYLFSKKLTSCDWPGLALVSDDMLGFVRKLKTDDGPELRILGSLSLMQQLIEADLLDMLRLMVCPLVLPYSGVEPTFSGVPDTAFTLASSRVLDGRVLLLDYRPAGAPPANV